MNQHFICIVCGRKNLSDVSSFSRESGICKRCKSTVRMRSAIRGLSLGLFGQELTIKNFPANTYRGIGLSDWAGYSWRLAKALKYRNSFIHARPFLDITKVPPTLHSTQDFVLSIDVFEHVPSPVHAAFLGVAELLRSSGLFVFSAPYTHEPETVEHFPRLNEFRLLELFGKRCLVNKKPGGELELYSDIRFHGGRGDTLEMRVFCFNDIVKHLDASGFERIEVLDDARDWGIHYENECSHTIIAFKR